MLGTAMVDLHKCRIEVVPDNESAKRDFFFSPSLRFESSPRTFEKLFKACFFIAARSKLGHFCFLHFVKMRLSWLSGSSNRLNVPRCRFICRVSCELKLERKLWKRFKLCLLLVVWDQTSEMSVVIF